MHVFVRLLTTAVAVVIAVLLGGRLIGSSTGAGATSSATESPRPASAAAVTPKPSAVAGRPRFTSTLNGIAIDYPVGWQVRPATERWTGGALSFDAPAADVIFDPSYGSDLYVLLASQPIEDEGVWREQVDRSQCPTPGSSEPGGRSEPSGGVDGFQSITRDCSGTHVATIAVLGRGYLIELAASAGRMPDLGDYDYSWLRHLMDTVDLRPSDADPTGGSELPFATGTFTSHGADIVLDARGAGPSISGTMEMRSDGGSATIALECTDRTAQGFLAIAGTVTSEVSMDFVPVGTRVMLLFGRGSPFRAVIHTQGTDRPHDATCAAFLATIGDVTSIMEPIEGTLALALWP
jgi:hypothetical protein